MTHEWKPGDRAMVTVAATGVAYASLDGAGNWRVPTSALSPLPSPIPGDPALARKVIDAADAWVSGWDDAFAHTPKTGTVMVLYEAVRAYRASLAPPDPVGEVIAAWKEAVAEKPMAEFRLDRALFALEASRK